VAGGPYHFKAFLSYSHRDAAWGAWLHRAIENYRIPAHVVRDDAATRLRPVFRDREELSTSANLSDSIRDALAESEYLIVVCSSQSKQSLWVNEEIGAFIDLGRERNILCFAIEEISTCLPSALEHLQPLAADARPEADGRRGAKLKLIAGLLNVRYDELARRDAARRSRRLATVAAGAVAGMAITSGLAYYAYLQRQEAIEQRVRATREAAALERVVDFMANVFEAGNPEIAMGRDPTASELLRSGVQRIDDSLDDDPVVKAKLLSKLGEVYWRRDDIAAASRLIERALALRQDLGQTGGEEYLRDLGVLAILRHEGGDFAEAERLYLQALEEKRRLYGGDDRQVLIAMANLGTLYEDTGRLDEALVIATDVLDRKRRALGESDPSTLTSVVNLVSVLGRLHRYDESISLLESSRSRVVEEMGEDHPLTLGLDENLAVLLHEQGQYGKEEPLRLSIVERKVRVLGEDHLETIVSKRNLAVLYRDAGRLEEASGLLQETLEIARRRNGETDIETLRTSVQLAAVWMDQGRYDRVVSDLPPVLRALAGQLTAPHPYLIDAMVELGQAYLAQERPVEALSLLRPALDQSIELFGMDDAETVEIRGLVADAGALRPDD